MIKSVSLYKHYIPLILLFLCGCSSEKKKNESKSNIENQANNSFLEIDSLTVRLLDSCQELLQSLDRQDTMVEDDISYYEKYYSKKEFHLNDLDVSYTKLSFYTGNASFDQQLNIKTANLSKKFIDYWQQKCMEVIPDSQLSKEDIANFKSRVRLEIDITPIYVSKNMISLAISTGELAGGTLDDGHCFYKNFIYHNKRVEEINSEDFIDNEIGLDTVYFNRLFKAIEFSSEPRTCWDGRNPRTLLCAFIIKTDTQSNLPFRSVNFTFHPKGVKIQYEWTRYGVESDFMGKVIPRNEFNKVISRKLMENMERINLNPSIDSSNSG